MLQAQTTVLVAIRKTMTATAITLTGDATEIQS